MDSKLHDQTLILLTCLKSYHFGVLKAFLEAGLLPRVITGTSAGGLVAAFCATRTDKELSRLLKHVHVHSASCSDHIPDQN